MGSWARQARSQHARLAANTPGLAEAPAARQARSQHARCQAPSQRVRTSGATAAGLAAGEADPVQILTYPPLGPPPRRRDPANYVRTHRDPAGTPQGPLARSQHVRTYARQGG